MECPHPSDPAGAPGTDPGIAKPFNWGLQQLMMRAGVWGAGGSNIPMTRGGQARMVEQLASVFWSVRKSGQTKGRWQLVWRCAHSNTEVRTRNWKINGTDLPRNARTRPQYAGPFPRYSHLQCTCNSASVDSNCRPFLSTDRNGRTRRSLLWSLLSGTAFSRETLHRQ
jgi:hypothetical protein